MQRGSRHSRQNYRLISRPQNFHLSLLGSLASCRTWRHLTAKVGTFRTTQGEYNKPSGCSASGAYVPGPDYEEEEEVEEEEEEPVTRSCLRTDHSHSEYCSNAVFQDANIRTNVKSYKKNNKLHFL